MKHKFPLVMIIMVCIVIIAMMSSFLFIHSRQSKNVPLPDSLAQTVEITSFRESDNVGRDLERSDIAEVKSLVGSSVLCEISVERNIYFALHDEGGNVFFIKSFSDEFLDRMLDNNDHDGALITLQHFTDDEISVSLPVVNYEGSVLQTTERVSGTFPVRTIGSDHPLAAYFTENELVAGENMFDEISELILPEIKIDEISRIYVSTEDAADALNIAGALESAGYTTNREHIDSAARFIYSLRTDIFVLSVLTFMLTAALFTVYKI